jgi:4-amino-4-deoxy-L-arabinose transferase-like glycosyltransferase
MTDAEPARADRALRWQRRAAAVVGAGFVALFMITALLRIRQRVELEWMEGAMVDVALRVLDGKKLYVAPTIEYVPFIYPPLYFYVSAAACALLGRGLFALRLVSLLGALGCIAFVFRFVQRETRDRSAATVAAGLYAATFAAGGAWFDLARIDSLFLCLLLAALYALRFAPERSGQIGGGVLLALSFATKQLALPIALPMLGLALWWRRYAFAASALLVGAALLGALDWAHDGWYTYYAIAVPSRHTLSFERAGELLQADLVRVLPVAGAFALGVLCLDAGRRALSAPRARAFYACLLASMLAGSALARIHLGGAVNALHPAYAAIAISFGLALAALWRMDLGAPWARASVALASVAMLAQFCLLAYDPRAFIPSTRDDDAGARMLARVRSVSGEVLVPFHGYVSSAAGKPAYAHEMAIHDLYRSGIAWQRWKQVDDALDRAIRGAQLGAVLVDDAGWHAASLRAAYRCEPLGADELPSWPLSGLRTRPTALCLPLRAAR